jgi:hypothetical protein
MYPAHLGPEFYQTYKEDIVDIRLQEKAKGKSGNKAIVDGFKEAANASFGNSNQINSWLYDPQYLIQTTINGQLMISMLVESLSILPESEILQTNTDGVTIKIKANDLDRYYEICKSWEETTKLKLEYAMMKSMFLWDVNNYIALYSDSTKPAKCKGRFQFNELELHKNKSNLVIPKAIFAFFNEGIAPEDYLKSNRNIYDYCSGVRTKSDWGFVETEVKNGILKERHLQKVIRYYISMSGSKILKVNKSDGRKINTQAGHWLQREFNTYEEKDWKEYTIDESFYLMNIHKEIKPLVVNKTKQLELF